jgi:hypothetical protein
MSKERDGSLLSRTTGLVLRAEGKRLRLVDSATGRRLLWAEEELRRGKQPRPVPRRLRSEPEKRLQRELPPRSACGSWKKSSPAPAPRIESLKSGPTKRAETVSSAEALGWVLPARWAEWT